MRGQNRAQVWPDGPIVAVLRPGEATRQVQRSILQYSGQPNVGLVAEVLIQTRFAVPAAAPMLRPAPTSCTGTGGASKRHTLG